MRSSTNHHLHYNYYIVPSAASGLASYTRKRTSFGEGIDFWSIIKVTRMRRLWIKFLVEERILLINIEGDFYHFSNEKKTNLVGIIFGFVLRESLHVNITHTHTSKHTHNHTHNIEHFSCSNASFVIIYYFLFLCNFLARYCASNAPKVVSLSPTFFSFFPRIMCDSFN